MICDHCQKEIPDGSAFCTECGKRVEMPTETTPPAPFVPQSFQAPSVTPAPIMAAPAAVYSITSSIDESGYYHLDSTECYDFEALRGISIVAIIISVLTLVGIVMPLPLAIISLCTSCAGIGARDPNTAKSKFNTSRGLIIATAIILGLIVIGGIILILSMANLADMLEKM